MTADDERPLNSDEAPQDIPELATDETERVDHTRPIAASPPSPVGPDARGRAPARQERVRQGRPAARTGYTPPQTPSLPGAEPGVLRASLYPAPQTPGLTGRRPVRRTAPASSGFYLPWWSLVVLVVFVGGAALALFLLFTEMSQPVVPGNQPARVQVVTSQPTLSRDFLQQGGVAPTTGFGAGPTPIPPAFPTPTVPLPTPIPSPSLPPGDFVIGLEVRVVGVGASGLNIRSAPGYAGTQRFLAAEGDTFAIVEGPQNVDGLEWWRVEDPEDPDRYGWAARNYLEALAQ